MYVNLHTQMAGIKFYLEKRKNKAGDLIVTNVPILLYYSFNGQRLQYFTGERVDAKNFINEYWKDNKEPIKKAAVGAERINRNLKSLRLHLENIHSDAKALGIPPTVDSFRNKLNDMVKGEPGSEVVTIPEALKLFLEYTKRTKAYNTFKNFQTTVNHLNVFFSKKKNKFSDLDGRVIEAFQEHLIGVGHLNNTVSKNLQVFRTFLNWCKGQGFASDFDISVKVKENDIDVIFLNYEDVMKLYSYSFINSASERVRDVFIFGCFTGMRYGDIAKLKQSDIEENQIKFRIEKAGKTKSHTVPLAPIAKAILEKYKNLSGEKALPVISNQKMNDALKVVCEIAGFDEMITIAEKQGNGRIIEKRYKKYELITCHTSRKSFITVSMMLGMPESVVKSITGHSKNSKAFAKYYDITDGHKQAEMGKIYK